MTSRQATGSPPAAPPPGIRVWLVAASLAAYAMLAPLGVAALAGPLPLRGFGTVALAMSLLGPGLATILVCWRGLGGIADELRGRPTEEPRQAIMRIFVTGGALLDIGVFSIVGMASERLQPLVAIDVGAALVAWLVLLHCILAPESRVRRGAALLCDTIFLSVFLHWSGSLATPWFVGYLAIAFDYGLRFGPGMLAISAAVNFIGFALVAATTPVWQDMPLAVLACMIALVVLPLYGAQLARRAVEARQEASEIRRGQGRLMAVLAHELKAPLDSVLGMGTLLARTKLDAAQRDMLVTVRLAALTERALIDDLLNPARLEAGDPAPQTETFVLREAFASAVAMLRPQCEAKGVTLAVVVDPRLPHVCRGQPLQLRQLALNLLGDAVARAHRGSVAVNATLVEREPGGVLIRLAVSAEDAAEAPDDTTLGRAIAMALAEQMGGRLVFDGDGDATLDLGLLCDDEASVPPPDLSGRRVALVSKDRDFADRVQSWLRFWRGETQWYAEGEDALTVLGGAAGHIVIIDGRHDALAGLSLAHRLAAASGHPTILFIAPPHASEAVAGLAATRLTAVIEDPVTESGLANALLSVIANGAAVVEAPPPAPAPPPSLGASQPAPAPATQALALLVADEAPDAREQARQLLERAGHRVELAADGGAALSALDKGGFDAALLALAMTGITGDAVAKLHRMRHPGHSVPLVALAGDTGVETVQRCREAGFDAVLAKPVEATSLASAIEQARAARANASATKPPAIAPPEVTPIASHPRFLGEGIEVVREATIDSLRGLGGNEFVAEVIETFRNDATRLVGRLRQAAERSDHTQFAELAHSLRSGAANIGGVRLCQTLTALEDLSPQELGQMGTVYVEKIEAELQRLELALEPFALTQRRG